MTATTSTTLPIITRRSRAWRWLRVLLIAITLLLLAAVILDRLFPLHLPAPDTGSTVVLARDGTPLRAFADSDGVWRYPTTAKQVSPLYLTALLHYEDRWFYRHPGINPYALARGFFGGLLHGHIVSGGSTLTMQVARVIDPIPHTFRGKLVQMFRALQLEAHLSKAQILDLYLNHAPFGGPIEGVEAASWAYLGKPASQLSPAEAALLAVLPQSPSRLRPDRHPDAARAARDKVLRRMRDLDVWSASQVRDAAIEPVAARSLHAPLSAALLAERLHQQQPQARRIVSSIDADLQRAAEERVVAYLSHLPPRTSAAVLVVDNATLEARVYVGTAEFADPVRSGHVDMVRAPRSPGSTLKPFLYGLALDDGLLISQSLLVDAPQDFGGYRPGNFDEAFSGPVSAAEALQRSLNVPAVDVLDRVGPARFVARLANGGIDLGLPDGAKPNLSIILGGAATRLENLVGAYTAFANAGIAGTPRYTPEQPAQPRRLLSPGAAWIVRDILASNPADVEGAPLEGAINRHGNVAWKTGTSYGYRDAWAIGVTDRWTLGVWIGRPDGTPSPGQYGAVTALPLLFQIDDMLPQRGGRAHAAAGQRAFARHLLAARRCRRRHAADAMQAAPHSVGARRRTAAHLRRARPRRVERGPGGAACRRSRPAPQRRLPRAARAHDPAGALAGAGHAMAERGRPRQFGAAAARARLRGRFARCRQPDPHRRTGQWRHPAPRAEQRQAAAREAAGACRAGHRAMAAGRTAARQQRRQRRHIADLAAAGPAHDHRAHPCRRVQLAAARRRRLIPIPPVLIRPRRARPNRP